jgi:hypothetical protein
MMRRTGRYILRIDAEDRKGYRQKYIVRRKHLRTFMNRTPLASAGKSGHDQRQGKQGRMTGVTGAS